jgi:hypothetical protein
VFGEEAEVESLLMEESMAGDWLQVCAPLGLGMLVGVFRFFVVGNRELCTFASVQRRGRCRVLRWRGHSRRRIA